MILCDVNVLLYALRTDSPDHERHRDWLHALVDGPSAYGVSPQVMASVVRISTHPRIFVQPSRLADALAFCSALGQRTNATLVSPGDRHWDIFDGLCREAAASGNLVQDAWFAALAIETGCEWVTTDRDYSRFPGLRWRTPW